jgi:lipopolysaccharide biosynthesis regulator YciM
MTEKIEKFVLTVMPDVCDANNKDPKAEELLKVMKTYGKVERYEDVIDAVTAEYQEALGNIRAQLLAIKDQDLTPEEMLWVSFIRARMTAAEEASQVKITALEKVIKDIRDKYKKRIAQFAALVEEDDAEYQ